LAACASLPADPVCAPAYPLELPIPAMIYSRLLPVTGEETVNRQRRTIKANLTCNLTWEADDRITHQCFGTTLPDERGIEASPAQARALIDALHLANVPEDRTEGGNVGYSLQSIECVEYAGCSTLIEPPCLP
jgi:hypothetical protein